MHAQHGVPTHFRECHIALVGGYVIEGHVPVDSIERLLKEKPAVTGLVVPGMPAGSPGMESPNGRPYDVMTFDRQGRAALYEHKQARFY
jgi:hypothetical protein